MVGKIVNKSGWVGQIWDREKTKEIKKQTNECKYEKLEKKKIEKISNDIKWISIIFRKISARPIITNK